MKTHKVYELLQVTAEKFAKGQKTFIDYVEIGDMQFPKDEWVDIEGALEKNIKRGGHPNPWTDEPEIELTADIWTFQFKAIGQHSSVSTFLEFLAEDGWNSALEGWEQVLVDMAEVVTKNQEGQHWYMPVKTGTFVTLWECWTEEYRGYEYADCDFFCEPLGYLDLENQAVIGALKKLMVNDTNSAQKPLTGG